MNRRNTYFVYSIILILWGVNQAVSQNRKVDRADHAFEQYRYLDARKIYEKVIGRGYESEEVYERLANTYYFNAAYAAAAKWYDRLFEYAPDYDKKEAFLRFSQALKAMGKDRKAKAVYLKYLEKTGKKDASAPMDYAERIRFNSGRYDVEPVKGLYDEREITYGKTVYNHELWYSSTYEKPKSFGNVKDAWTGLSFVSIFKVPVDTQNRITGKPKRVRNQSKKSIHRSSPVFTKDGNTVYFTQSNTISAKEGADVVLQIYRASIRNGVWQDPEKLEINGNDFSTAHPALSPEEDILYFSSDREGGRGNTDLYAVALGEDGSLGEVQNLGDQINTAGREVFPFVTEDHELYFSSDGHFGLGGLDVFYVKIEEDGSMGPVVNVGEPINSRGDDFAFGINSKTKYGFVSSNRGLTDSVFVKDNIYSFKENSPIRYHSVIEGIVTDKDSDQVLKDVAIVLTDFDGEEYARVRTDEEGHYQVKTNIFDTYHIRATKTGYEGDEKVSESNLEYQKIDFALLNTEIKAGTDLAKLLNISMIHFDFDKYNIRSDAEVELEKVIAVMEEYPELKINIRSHTDSRGSRAYNDRLSRQRAQSTKAWLVDHGIDPDRLTAEGLGERELLNECKDGVPCTREQHQVNRRSEFIIVD